MGHQLRYPPTERVDRTSHTLVVGVGFHKAGAGVHTIMLLLFIEEFSWDVPRIDESSYNTCETFVDSFTDAMISCANY